MIEINKELVSRLNLLCEHGYTVSGDDIGFFYTETDSGECEPDNACICSVLDDFIAIDE